MGVVGIGVDVVDVTRFAAALERTPGLADRVLTAAERATCGGNVARLAARFAVKEAVAKALGAPPGLGWHDVEVVLDHAGRPSLRATGTVAAAAGARDGHSWHVSLSHDGGLAVAMVVLES